MKSKNTQHYSRFTDKGPSIAERVIRSIRKLLKKPVFERGNANWISELPSVIKQYKHTIHHSNKVIRIVASKTINEKEFYSNLKDKKEIRKPKFKLGQLVRTTDNKRVFSKSDSGNYSYKLHTITEIIHDTIPSYRINYLPEGYNEIFLIPTKITLEENDQVLKKLSLIQ